MKRKLYTFTFAAAIAFALVFAGACKEDEESATTPTPALSVDKTAIAAVQAGGTYDLAVTANVAWTASASETFVTLDPGSGSSDATVKVTVTPNNGQNQRTATITVGAEGVEPKTVTVTQPGTTPVLTVAPATLAFPTSGGEGQAAQITTNVAWEATSSADWLTVTPNSGTATADLTVTATDNSGEARNATITFSATGVASQTIEVTQAAASIEVSSETISIDADGTRRTEVTSDMTDTLTVTASVAWTVAATTLPADNPTLAPAHTDDHEWVSVSQENNMLLYKIDGNPYPRERSATITVSADGANVAPKEIIVTQGARTQQFVGGSVVGVWDGSTIPAFTETSSGIFEIERAFSGGVFKLPLLNAYPTAFFAAGTTDEEIEVDGAENDLYFVPLTIGWYAGEIDLKWKINTAGYYKLTVNLNTMKVKLETGTPPSDPESVFIGGVQWARNNVDAFRTFASASDNVGKYYQFRGNTGYSDTDTWPGANGADNPVDNGWPSDKMPCPAGYKLLGQWIGSIQADEVLSSFSRTYRAAGTAGNSVNGVFFGPNSANATINDQSEAFFIPFAGYRDPATGTLTEYGEKAYIHTGNAFWGVSSQILVIDETSVSWNRQEGNADPSTFNWGTGASVRCIKE
jgi:hypothetical protein